LRKGLAAEYRLYQHYISSGETANACSDLCSRYITAVFPLQKLCNFKGDVQIILKKKKEHVVGQEWANSGPPRQSEKSALNRDFVPVRDRKVFLP
jgi:hypothetical protein